MKTLLSFASLLFVPMLLLAQSDTSAVFSNGNTRFEGQMLDGKRHGKWTWYFQDGNIKKVEQYKAGLKEGSQLEFRPANEKQAMGNEPSKLYSWFAKRQYRSNEIASEVRGWVNGTDTIFVFRQLPIEGGTRTEKWYENGKRESIVERDTDGTEHGINQYWDDQGLMLYDYRYDHGKLTGDYSAWYTTGILKARRNEGAGIATTYFRNGAPERITFIDSQCGDAECYTWFYESGRKREEHIQVGNTTRLTRWFTDGGIEEREINDRYERLSGWHPNGAVKYQALYLDGTGSITWWLDNGVRDQVGHYEKGLKTGTWQYWDSDGKLIREVEYEAGKELRSTSY